MRSCLLSLFLLFSITSICQRTPKQYTIEQFYDTRVYGGGIFNKEENKLLIQDNSGKKYNIFEINLTDGEKEAYSLIKGPGSLIGYIPNSSDILFSMDSFGKENRHIYLQTKKGKVTDLTPGSRVRAEFHFWARTGDKFYYTTNARDVRQTDLYKMSVGEWKPELVYENEKGYLINYVSPNEQLICLRKPVSPERSEMYLYDVSKKEYKRISPENAVAHYSCTAFEPDNSALYYTTDEGEDFTYLVKYNLETGVKERFFKAEGNVLGMHISPQGRYHYIVLDQDAHLQVRLFDHKTNQPIELPKLEGEEIQWITLAYSETAMILHTEGDKSPPNMYYYNLGSKELKKLTQSLSPDMSPEDLVVGQKVRYESFDSLKIPAIYYKPLNSSPSNKVPAIIWLHGGPGGQNRVGYSQTIQYFVNHGYAVLAVNNRGSSGYGKAFQAMDTRNHGDKDLKDCLWGKKWLAEQGEIDTSKVGIYGSSYGGFLALAGIIQYPAEFGVCVDMCGVTNWIRTLKSMPAFMEGLRAVTYEKMGDPDTDSVRLRGISPAFHADKIKVPLIVLQGQNDPRVLQTESDLIVGLARRNGVPVEYYLFPGEGHGLIYRDHLITAARVTLEFLDLHLKKSHR